MTTKRFISLLAVCIVPLALSACFDEEEKVLDIVLTGETYADFSQNELGPSWTRTITIDVAEQIRDILENNGYDQDDLESAHVTSVSYGVTEFDQAHDWTISGSISVSYLGAPQPIVNYTSQSVQSALNQKISAPLQQGGVDELNTALADFVSGDNPSLQLSLGNASTTPEPGVGDPMIFTWRAWLAIQVIIDQDVKVFDPF